MDEKEVKESEHEWCIVLRSKHSGDEIHFGSRYKTYEEAEEAAEKDCCSRCNGVSIKPIYHPDMVWFNKDVGFVPKSFIEGLLQEKEKKNDLQRN